jgi:AcrR family transcriptional regulator
MATAVIYPVPDIPTDLETPQPPRQERSRRTFERLLSASLEVFREKGYEGASLEEIATRAGGGVGTFYGRFRGKRQAMVLLMHRYLQEDLAPNLARLDFAGDPLLSLERVIWQILVPRGPFAGFWRAWHEAVARDPRLEQYDESVRAWAQAAIEHAINRAALARPVRADLDRAATAYLIRAMLWRLGVTTVSTPEVVVPASARMVFHAIFPDEGTVPR